MGSEYTRRMMDLVNIVYRKNPAATDVSQTLSELSRLSRRILRVEEALANGFQTWNGDWDEAATIRAEKRQERYERKAGELAAALGATVYIQGDCRGWPVYLLWPGDLRDGEAAESYYNMRGVAVPPAPR